MTEVNEAYAKHLARQGFVLSEKLGSGLSGSVYRAEQPSLSRDVAVKFFDNAISQRDEDLRKRFTREAKILAKLAHPNIPYVITTGSIEEGSIPYTVMQYIVGETLEMVIRDQMTDSVDMKLAFIRQVLSALDTVHSNKILHRDIKPSNIMWAGGSQCFLIDFSIGAATQHEPGLTRSTKTGSHLGTPEYMSPEQMRDMTKIDHRSDLYSVGIVLLELLTGSTDKTDITLQLNEYGNTIARTVAKACQSNPDDRFQSASDFSRALGETYTTRSKPIEPALALCPNTKCPEAAWSSRGYYRGPNVIQHSTDVHCTSCGTALIYQCRDCGAPFADKPFCGACGAANYRIPECQQCGSWLEMNYMDTDTAANGCGKCRRKREKQGFPQAPPTLSDDTSFEDDIPF